MRRRMEWMRRRMEWIRPIHCKLDSILTKEKTLFERSKQDSLRSPCATLKFS